MLLRVEKYFAYDWYLAYDIKLKKNGEYVRIGISWGWQSLDGLLTDIRHDDWYRKYWISEETTSKHVLYAPVYA